MGILPKIGETVRSWRRLFESSKTVLNINDDGIHGRQGKKNSTKGTDERVRKVLKIVNQEKCCA
jgi:hypothetical protein